MLRMGKGDNKIKTITADGIDFQSLPTSDRPSKESAFDIPAVKAARNIKKEKRLKVAKYAFSFLLILSSIVILSALLLTQETKEVDISAAEEEKISAREASLQAREREAKARELSNLRREEDIAQREKTAAEREQAAFQFPEVNLEPLADDIGVLSRSALDKLDLGDIKNFGMEDLAGLGRSSAELGMKLYGEEIKKNDGNLLFSPYSIQSALAMVGMGAKGPTLTQMMDLYRGSGPTKSMELDVMDMTRMLGAALPTLQSTENLTIEAANSVFLDKNYEILDTMKTGLNDYFKTSIMQTEYSNPQKAVDLINTWVGEKTRQKIKELVSTDSINTDTKMVLVNALYFKGLWATQFDKEVTVKDTFYVDDTKTVEADFMIQKKKLKVGRYQEHTFVALPYSGDRFVMYLFIPHNVSDFKSRDFFFNAMEETVDGPLSILEKLLVGNPYVLADSLNLKDMEEVEVNVRLPRFKIEAALPLKEDLERLGVSAIFSAVDADLSNISGNRDLFLADALHKAYLEVTEEGSEGGAATALVAQARSFGPPALQANFNRPFMFFIKDDKTGLIIFQGRMVDPTLGM